MKHLHHFNLMEDPFRNDPLLKFLYESGPQQEALLRLDRAVRQAKGLCVLIGDVGSGKTMVVRQLLDSLEEEVFEASMMVVLNGAADADWMLTRFARQLGVEEPPAEREAVVAEIYDRLAIVREDGRHAVLIIDDAQALAEPETLSAVCGLLKLEYEDRRLLTLVLAGTPNLAQALAGDPMLAHRADVKVNLAAFDPNSSAEYLGHRVRCAGGNPGIFQPGAVSALHHYGRGIPGLMNTLADNALFEAFLCGRGSVTKTDVDRAQSDLSWEVPAPAPPPAAGSAQAHPPVPAPAPATQPSVGAPSFDALDSELEAVFEPARANPEPALPYSPAPAPASPAPGIDPTSPEAIGSYAPPPQPVPNQGPPKQENDDDLFVELLDD